MTTRRIDRQIAAAKAAIMAGQAGKALEDVDHLMQLLQSHPPSAADRVRLQARLAELRDLAEAALTGAQAAAADMQAILQAARCLETYDQCGTRRLADSASTEPRRY